MSESDPGQSTFPDFVKDLLEAEDKRRESLDSRGMSVITVSGTLVTLLLALSALVTTRQGFVLQGAAHFLLVAAVVAFVLAAVLAIATYVPQPVRITDPADLAQSLPKLWHKGAAFALQKTTATRIDELSASQNANDLKARLLLAAACLQVLAILLLAGAVIAMV